MMSRHDKSIHGYTLVELLVTILVVLLLASIGAISYEKFQQRARKVQCISQMRSLHSSFTAYWSDHGHWPQLEEDEFEFTEAEFFDFWVSATEPYGAGFDTWICPEDRRLERKIAGDELGTIGSYVVTRFDEKSQSPFRWNQPWIMERGSFHGGGAHILMPDGSVQSSTNPFFGR